MVAIHGRRGEGLLVRNTGNNQSFYKARVFTAIAIGVLLGFVFAFLLHGSIFFLFNTRHIAALDHSHSGTQIEKLKSEIINLREKNSNLARAWRGVTQQLELALQNKDDSEKGALVLPKKEPTAGPSGFGIIETQAPPTRVTVMADEVVNPRLAKLLREVAVNKELIVALANSHVKNELEIWFSSIKRVGITNYLVVALDEEMIAFCESQKINFYKRDADGKTDDIGRNGGNHAVSGLKYGILREFLQSGYSVLLSDIDIVYLQNPFDHLYRDSDIEAMSDGHDDITAYGYDEVFDEPEMGWARYAHTIRIWVYNSGFFYIRPTVAAMELLDRVASRLIWQKESWDQQVFNEQLFLPSSPNYRGLHASRRTMDRYLFMNSKFLFKTVRHDAVLGKTKPVVVHLNYHPDKLPRMQAVVDYYVNGEMASLKAFPLAYPFPDTSDVDE